MKRSSPAWYDQQYDNRARVPGHPAILQQWFDTSALTRQRLRCALDVPYGDDATERLDIFHPTHGNAPVLVYIHGGYWRALDKRDQSFVATPFVEAGAMVVMPNYALCPAVTIEHIVLQLVQATAWVHRHAAEYGGDPARIVVSGHSAGGHLAAMLLACDWPAVHDGLPQRLVKAAVAISGVFDLEPLRHAPFLAPDLRLDAASARRLSPVRMPAPKGPLVALVGADESAEFLRQTASIAEAWGPTCVMAREAIPGRNHLDVLGELADPATRAHRWALHLLGLGASPKPLRDDRLLLG
ncbi:MAG: alpha/beta hydrolase [Caldimonas sp.]